MIRTLLALLIVPLKRLRANAGLALCVLLAITAAVALAVCVPVYAEAASLRVLQRELIRAEERTARPAFALLFRYLDSAGGAQAWDKVGLVDGYLSGAGLAALRLPQDGLTRHVRTPQLRLLLPPEAKADRPFLKNIALGFVSGLDAQIQIGEGTAPAPAAAGAPIPVLVSRALADELGLNVGDALRVLPPGDRPTPIDVQVSGVWQAANAADPAWVYPPDAFNDILLVAEPSFTGPIAAALPKPVAQAVWYARLNPAGLSAASAGPLLRRVQGVEAQVAGALPGLKLEQGPTDPLTRYQTERAALTSQLATYAAPILALTLYFIVLLADLLVTRQRGELALLKSRGVSDITLLGMAAVEWLLLGGLALAAGPWLGLAFASAMSRTIAFMRLSDTLPPAEVALSPFALGAGAAAVALAVLAALSTVLLATRRTLVDEQRAVARAGRPPLWQRLYLDLLLLAVTGFGVYQLRTGGALPLIGTLAGDPFAGPLPVLLPLLFCCSLGLLAVRLAPLLLRGLARLARLPNWTVPLVALRQLARQPNSYRGVLLLLVLTLSLATFSAALAATLDGALVRAVDYQVGADTQLIESGVSRRQPPRAGQPEEPKFLFVPLRDHLSVPGVRAAARVGAYPDATIALGTPTKAQLVGIDRLDFPQVVSRFEPEWAEGQSLGALMNLLGSNAQHALVSRDALAKGVKVGDALPLSVQIGDERRETVVRVVGVVDLWPGFYPQDGPIVVVNLDYLFEEFGGEYPYDVWLAREPQADVATIARGVRELGATVLETRDRATLLAEGRAEPRRQGLFGLLSVGFVACGALTLVGLLVSALVTARRRAIELGVLGALGLARWQVGAVLALEQLLLVGGGVAAGTAIGVGVALLVVPLLRGGGGPYAGTPPAPAQLDWSQTSAIYIVFGVALALTLLALLTVIQRMRLDQAVKLGDTN